MPSASPGSVASREGSCARWSPTPPVRRPHSPTTAIVGPDAVLALAGEGYRRRDVRLGDLAAPSPGATSSMAIAEHVAQAAIEK